MSLGDYPAPSRAETLTFDCQMRGPDLVGLSFKNALLNVVTLSLYRFWAKTEVRRRIWSAVTLNGDAVEYTGRGMELFKGFLIAAVVFGVPFVILSFLSQMIGPVGPVLFVAVFYIALFALIGFATFTAFRYQASRTTWRGVRFELTGSPTSYGLLYLGMLLLGGVTLGWYWPAAARRLAAPLWGGLRFGDRPLRFDIDASRKVGLYKPFAFAWCGGMAVYLLLFSVLGVVGAVEEAGGATDPTQVLSIFGIMLLALPVMALLVSVYEAAKLRAIAAGIRLDGVRFELDAKWTSVASLWLTNALIVVVSFGVFAPIAQMRTIRFVVQRLKAIGEVDLSSVRQVERGPKTGEGLADILDLSPI